MALTGRERQARHRQRLKDAARGVTPDMVREATKIIYQRRCEQAEEVVDWPAFVASCHKRRGGNDWSQMVPEEIRADAYDWIEDERERELIQRVAAVSNAVLKPPPS